MAKCISTKKMTLRLLAAALMFMTAVAFMPVVADTVWADDEAAETPVIGNPKTSMTDTNDDGKSELRVNIGYGDIQIKGTTVYYHFLTEDGLIEDDDYDFGVGGYENVEIIVTGTTPSTYKLVTDEDTSNLTNQEIGPYTLNIDGGPHFVTLEDVTMKKKDGSTVTYAPITLEGTYTNATITVSGENSITGYSSPGIRVPNGSSLTILEDADTPEEDKLIATATNGSYAGIGGSGTLGQCGNITIESGNITATGSGGGAGIGGSGSGTGNITINGGTIRATGGNDTTSITGAPGIGSGSSRYGGNVTINGGNITAIGGYGMTSSSASAAQGIAAQNISTGGNTMVLTSTGGIYLNPNPTNSKDFNAIIWTDANPADKKNARVYGHVLMSDKAGETADGESTYQAFDLGTGNLTIPDGTSATVIGIYNCTAGSSIDGDGYLIIGDGNSIEGFHRPESGEPKMTMSFYNGYDRTKPGEHAYVRVNEHLPIYDGEPVDLEELITIQNPVLINGQEHYLDVDNWDAIITNSNNQTVELDSIIDAGPYTITYSHKQHAYSDFYIAGAEILQKEFSDYMVDMETSFDYGDDIQYSVTDDDVDRNDGVLVETIDYDVKFREVNASGEFIRDFNSLADISEVGYYQAIFTGKGNYTSVNEDGEQIPVIIDFEIEPTSIKDATITVSGAENFVYNGKPMHGNLNSLKNNKITVTLDGKKITAANYDIEFTNNSLTPAANYSQEDHITYAGTVKVTVTANGENYKDSASTTFVINPRSVEVEWATAAYSDANGTLIPRRVYDGTDLVKISHVELRAKDIIDDDVVYVDLNGLDDDPTDDLTGTVTGSDAGPYETVSLKDVRLAGADAKNYKVTETTGVDLQPQGFEVFEITRLPVPMPVIEVTDKPSANDAERFQCTVNVTNAPNDGAKYRYGVLEKEGGVDEIQWQESNVFDGLLSNTDYWFYCKVDDSEAAARNMYGDPPTPVHMKHKTPLIPQEPPEAFELEFTLDAGGESYTVTIPIQEGAQYSFDGKNFNKSNVLKNVGANETITGYVRFPATKTHAVSDIVSSTDITPPLTVKTPVISPEDGAFYGSVKVSISTATDGATIYYTTDGNYPTASSEVYRTPFTITEDTTITAIAVKDEMEDSEAASVDYVYTEYEPITEASTTSGVKVTNDLKDSPVYSQKDSITAALSRAITEDGEGYTYQNIAYYDLNVKISFDNGVKYVKATADNFPEEGVEITLPFPKDTSDTTHDFRVAHMFSQTSDRLDTTAGEIEKPEVSESAAGITVTVTGCSPLAIGWVDTGEEGDPPGEDDPNTDDEGEDNADQLDADGTTPNGTDGTGNNDADGQGGANADGQGGNNADGTGANADGAGAGANADGADNGTNAEGENGENNESGAGGVVDELVNAVSTGDYTNPLLWAAIAILSFFIMITVIAVKRRH